MTAARRLLGVGVRPDACRPHGLAGAVVTLGVLAAVPAHALPAALAVLVGVVGMPHGGLDHRTGRALLAAAVGPRWPIAFLAGYGAVMAAVLAGWFYFPLLTLAGFVILSAAHFGTTDEPAGRPGRLALAVLQGGAVVWVPALFQPAEFTRLLGWVVPNDLWPAGVLFHPAVRAGLWAALAVAAVRAMVSPGPTRAVAAGFLVLFAVAPPLVSFAVYFCGWHSVVELARLAKRAGPDDPAAGFARVAAAAAPLSVAAVLLGVAGWLAVAADLPAGPGVVQVVFVGLSVVAVPHILLGQIAAGRDACPFGPGVPA